MEIHTSEDAARHRGQQPPRPEAPRIEAGGWRFEIPASGKVEPAGLPGYWALLMLEASQAAYGKPTHFKGHPVRFFDRGSTQALGWEQDGHLCLAFRGTLGLRDWGVDLLALLYGEPATHGGFALGWAGVRADVLRWIGTYPEATRPPLVLAGHSLGGALAALAAFDLASSVTVAGVFTYGAPRAGSPEFARAYKARPCGAERTLGDVTWRVTHEGDPVPISPPPLIYRHVGRHVPLSGLRLAAPLMGANPAAMAKPHRPEPETPMQRFARAVAPVLEASVGAQVLAVNREIFARSPVIAMLLTLVGFALLFISDGWESFSAGLAQAATSPWVQWPAGVLSFLLFQQLTYIVPKVPWLLRVAAGAAMFWLALTYLWPLMVGIEASGLLVLTVALSLRVLLAAAPDHMLEVYAGALGPDAGFQNRGACEALGLAERAPAPQPKAGGLAG
jgi:hypothetical protein